MKRILFLVLALALLALPVSAVEYTHLTNLSFTGYFAFGEEGSETVIFDSTGSFTIPDDIDLSFGGTGKPVSIEWTTADANANCLIVDLPTGGAVDVPAFGIVSADADFGYFNGVVEPTFFVENLAGSSYVALSFSGTTLAQLVTGGSATQLSITSPILINTGSTSITDYTPSRVIGYDAGAAMTIAVSDTTGNVAITHAGSTKAITWTSTGGLTFTGAVDVVGSFSVDGTTALVDGSTSVRGVSAGFTSLESPANRIGVNATEYMQIATTATTGATAITHTGSGAAVTWAAPSLAFTGDFSSDGATAVLDGSTSVRVISAGFNSIEGPATRIGPNATTYMNIAVAATTGNTTITHVAGSTDLVTWTAAGGFDFVGAFAADALTLSDVLTFSDGGTIDNTAAATLTITETNIDLVGALAADAVTLSDVLTFSDAGTIDNTGADDLTITEVNIILEGAAKTNSLTIDDGNEDVKIDSDNQTATLPTINIPDFVDATADFLVTNLFTTVLPFHGGLAGEDTDAVGTNGGGFVGGGAIDVTTYDYNDGAAGANDVLCKVYDVGTTTWDDLKTAALLTGAADWAINYQLLPDADAEAVGDAFAIGFDEKFCAFAFNDLATDAGAFATWGGNGAKWQYSTGAGTWADLTVYDGTDSTAQDGLRPLQRPGEVTFVPPANWVVATYDGEEAYWVQCVVTAEQLTQTPVIDTTNHDEPIIPFPTDGLPAPFKLEVTKVRVANMHTTVHDQAIVFIIGNFTDGEFTAAQTWTASQPCDTFTLASALAFDPGDILGIVCTNDTGSTQNPVWAAELTVTYED